MLVEAACEWPSRAAIAAYGSATLVIAPALMPAFRELEATLDGKHRAAAEERFEAFKLRRNGRGFDSPQAATSDLEEGLLLDPTHALARFYRGRTRWDNMSALLPANFIPWSGDDCVACGVCTERCFFNALTIDEPVGRSVVNPDKCIGCGVCTLACPQETLKLYRYERSTPFSTTKEMVKTISRENRE